MTDLEKIFNIIDENLGITPNESSISVDLPETQERGISIYFNKQGNIDWFCYAPGAGIISVKKIDSD